MTFRALQIHLLLTICFQYFSTAHSTYLETKKGCGKEPHVFRADKANFTSPGGFNGYSVSEDCTWDIELSLSAVVEITFHDFDLELSKICTYYDYVNIIENCNGTWTKTENASDAFCGNRSAFTVRTRCGRVRVLFHSDESANGRGFNATYESIVDKKKPTIACLGRNDSCVTKATEIETNPISLTCKVEGHPLPEVFWEYRKTKNSRGQAIDISGERFVDFHNGTIHIKELEMNDTGLYECFANNSLGKDVQSMELHVEKKCTCPKNIKTNWYSIPPYMSTDHGLFRILLEKIVQTCCGNCTGGHGPSTIHYEGGKKNSLMEVKESSNVEALDTLSFPIAGKQDDREFQSRLDFMPLISSPGVAFIVVDEEPGASARAVFMSVLSGWPILLLTMLMALLSGMVMWALDTRYNPDEFPPSFIKGSGEGFWWAFVTMTTVGYGDRSPRGILARIFAIIWVLVGLVITSIFTGVVTTSLTAITLSTDVKLYGTSIAAITNSTEYRLGISKNARMHEKDNFGVLIEDLKERKFKGALIDTYVAGELPELENKHLRINKIIDHDSHYGVVFGGSGYLSDAAVKQCVEDYVLINKAFIFKLVEDNTHPMKKPSTSAAVEKSSGLFDSDSILYKNAVYGTLGLLLLFTACGILWDFGYMRRWRQKTPLEELELLGGPAMIWPNQNQTDDGFLNGGGGRILQLVDIQTGSHFCQTRQ